MKDEFSLYDVLGLSKDATDEEITTAYRKLAKEFHPDRNAGDENAAAQYHRIDQAYSVLIDPVRRREYDETGRAREHTDENQDLLQVLVPALMNSLQVNSQFGKRVESVDIVDAMVKMLKGQMATMEESLQELRKIETTLTTASTRFTVDGSGENLFTTILEGQLRAVKKNIQHQQDDLDKVQRGLNYLKKTKYRRDGDQSADEFLKSLQRKYKAIPWGG